MRAADHVEELVDAFFGQFRLFGLGFLFLFEGGDEGRRFLVGGVVVRAGELFHGVDDALESQVAEVGLVRNVG